MPRLQFSRDAYTLSSSGVYFLPGFVIFSENTPFSFLFSFSVEKISGRKFSGSPSSTASIVVLLVQPAPEEEDLTKEGE